MAAFIPRTVQRKPVNENSKITNEVRQRLTKSNTKGKTILVDLRKSQGVSDSAITAENTNETSDDQQDGDDDEVVSFSKNQRWPKDGEPVCIMCGRYGEYICSKTEQDVCSLECKAKHLKRCGMSLDDSTSTTTSSSTDSHFSTNQQLTLQKYKYSEHHSIKYLTEGQVIELRNRLEIQVKGESVARPIIEFEHCQFSETLSKNIRTSGYISPTPIQMQLISVALSGRDIVACAQTGSGKTAAFLLPIISGIHYATGSLPAKSEFLRHPLGLILAPTRELCSQIEKQAKELMQGLTNMRTALVVGGLPLPPQLHRLQMGVQIIIATPGRLLEILSKDALDLTYIRHFVLDEVDGMLQLGFEQQVQEIIEKLSDTRQTIMVSATIPSDVETMVLKLTQNPVFISVGNPSTPTQSVKQLVIWVEEKAKKKHLFSILNDKRHYQPPVVVFVDSKVGAGMLAEAIHKVCGIRAVSMHGDKEQKERFEILQSYIEGQYPVIVCTGVLGRGVDLLNVKQVINFDMPSTMEDYIHQVGRAGRLGTSGVAMTFINNNNKSMFLDLVDTLSPLGVSLPGELTNSSYINQLRNQRKQGVKRKRDEFVDQGGLMDLLKKSSTRRNQK